MVDLPHLAVPFHLSGSVLLYRNTTDDAPPVEVRDLTNSFWRVLDGRHRYLASVIALT